MASVSENEIAASLKNGQGVVVLRNILVNLRDPQPPTPIKSDNTTAVGNINKTILQQKNTYYEHAIR